MKESIPLKFGSIAALYLLWFVSWLALREAAFGPPHYSWSQSLVAAVGAGVALRSSRHVPYPYPTFLLLLGVGLFFLAGAWVTYDPDFRRPFFHFGGEETPDHSDINYAGFVFTWLCAWGYLAIVGWSRQPPSALTSVVFVTLVFGLAMIHMNFYVPMYSSILDTIAGRLSAAVSGIEFLTLSLGVACILLGQPVVIRWLIIASAGLIASSMVYALGQVPEAGQPIWMFTDLLLVGIFLVLPDTLPAVDRHGKPSAPASEAERSRRSGLSGVLLLLSLGAVLLTVAVWLAPIPVIWRSFFSILFVVVLVVILVWITDRFDETVQFLKTYAITLYRQRLTGGEWREADARIRAILHSTGLGTYLDTLRDSAARLKQDVLFLGPERLYPRPRESRRQGEVCCFLVMPFSLEWSDEVYRILASACKAAGVQALRGDDLFTPTDILDDIWQAINAADFVIADITGRNPNVLYELGLAHALAKPVLIVSRNAQDIPIDLSTRRVILYGHTEREWSAELAGKAAKAITDILNTYGLSAKESGLSRRETMP
ncbi:MAG: hypothetical protein HOP18_14200 [Deltaproteobacteria bacterium]|nr:hypothetical protein [Deltaproteobacteria bacterium]